MLFDKKTVLSLASALAALPGALAVAVLQNTSGQSNGAHVDYVFNIKNADIQPVSTVPLFFPSQLLIPHVF
jgi:hypothetical protein